MKISDKGISLLKRHEGLVLHAYDDFRPHKGLIYPADKVHGTLTIGYGHTKTVQPGQCITEKEAERLLREDLEYFEKGVARLLDEIDREHPAYPIQQHEFDALVSFAFNVGLGALDQSTLLSKLLDGNPRKEVGDEFLRWVYSKGRPLRGLEKRRKDERDMFLGFKLSG